LVIDGRYVEGSELVVAAEQRRAGRYNLSPGDFDSLRDVDHIQVVLAGLHDFSTASCPIASAAASGLKFSLLLI
jgi:hypothetical protein